jgi:hypothetical protein|tara:strand:- start:190 stop:450 length:261 start_codon:yes stop_codon:yes gene_type:complete
MKNIDGYVAEITNLLTHGATAEAVSVWDDITNKNDIQTIVAVHRQLSDAGTIEELTAAMVDRRETVRRRTLQTPSQTHDLWDTPED